MINEDTNKMNICDVIIGASAIAAATKFFAELVRKGNAKDAAWSTLQSVGEVTSKIATGTAKAGDAVASYAKQNVPQEDIAPETQEEKTL